MIVRALLAIIVLLAWGGGLSAQGSGVAARVNGDVVTDFELQQRITLAARDASRPEAPDLRERLAPQVLHQMIDERLQIQNAQALGLHTTGEEVDRRTAEMERAAGAPRGAFKAYLQAIGVPYDIASRRIEADIAWDKIVRGKVQTQVDMSDAEALEAASRRYMDDLRRTAAIDIK